jgi:hypothetical protein
MDSTLPTKTMKFSYLVTFLLALSQLITPLFLRFNGFETVNPLIIPAAYAFAIWGLITVGCVVFAGYQLFNPNLTNGKFDNINLPAMVLFSCFSIWIYFASINLQFVTILVFLVMFGCLLIIHKDLQQTSLTQLEKIIVQAPFLIYLGWTTIAIFANITSWIAEQGWIKAGEESLPSYLLILAAALGNAIWVGTRVRFNWYYVATIIWAFVAIVVGAYSKGSIAVPAFCGFAIIVLLGSKYYVDNIKIKVKNTLLI